MCEMGFMVDTLTVTERSERMSRIRGKNTKPEMRVRRMIYGMGYRYRLHQNNLPGKPDLVFPGRRKVIFIHGCFWHRHQQCSLARLPKSRLDYWLPKLDGNLKRDELNYERLKNKGWSVMVIWECELYDNERILFRIVEFLGKK